MVSSSGWAATIRVLQPHSAGISARHPPAEIRELLDALRWTGMVRTNSKRLRREAEGDGDIELVQRRHHFVEPGLGPGAVAIRPTQPRAEALHPKPAQP